MNTDITKEQAEMLAREVKSGTGIVFDASDDAFWLNEISPDQRKYFERRIKNLEAEASAIKMEAVKLVCEADLEITALKFERDNWKARSEARVADLFEAVERYEKRIADLKGE